ncbi:MAG: PAS domain-containing sensor histidine kinase [Bacteroidales bacterium]
MSDYDKTREELIEELQQLKAECIQLHELNRYHAEARDRIEPIYQGLSGLAQLINNLPGMAYTCLNDKDWTMKFVSDGSLELTGYLSDEFRDNAGIAYNNIIYPDDRNDVWKSIQEKLILRESFSIEYRIITKSGLVKTVWERGQGIYSPDNTVHHLEGFITDMTDRKRIDDALKESEFKFRNLVKDMQVGVLLQGPGAEIFLCNLKALELLGLSEDQLLGKSSFDPDWNVIHEDGTPFPGPTHPVPEAIATRLPVRNVIMGVYRPATGDRVWLLVDAEPQYNDDGTVRQVVCTFINITKRKHAEELLRKSQASLSSAQSIAHLGSWEWEMKTNFFGCSEELLRIFGIAPESFTNDAGSLLQYIHPDDKELYLHNLSNASQKGEPVPFEYRIIRTDGQIRNLYAQGQILFDDHGIPLKGIGTVQDITDRKQTEIAISESEKRYRRAQEVGHVGSWEYDIKNDSFWGSDEGKRIYGFDIENANFSAEEVMKCVIDPDTVNKAMTELIERDIPYNIIFDINPVNGRERKTISSIAELIRDENGVPLKVTGVMRDITEQRKAENEIRNLNETLEQRVKERTRQLEKSNRELSFHLKEIEQFTYIASHDLQEPLLTMSNYTQLLKDEYAGKLDDVGNTSIEFIANSASRMRSLVKGLLDYSLLGKESVTTIVDMKKLVHEVLLAKAASVKHRKAVINVTELPTVTGYEPELKLLLEQLILNAIKFQPENRKPEVTISAVDLKKEWVISVKDNGIGILEKDMEKIFIIFKRMHNRNEYSGIGIGLAHCKKIVELHGGKIWVESTPGESSTFSFSIPKIYE